jgi:uncharacterized protein DUF3500
MRCVIACALLIAIAIPAAAHEEQAANEMAAAARSLVDSFKEEQKAAGVFAVEDDHRHDWHFVPKERKGISLKDMTPQQRHLTTALLASSLSSQGMVKTGNIMALEQVLQAMEGANARFTRDPELYYVSIFGDPASGKTWGWRIEGHHLALSFTVADGQHISSTPSMMGANPAIVPDGPHKGLQVLADEENIARELAKSLSSKQKPAAIISEKAPADIITGNRRDISPLEPAGIRWADFDPDQQKMVWELVNLYVQRARGEIAEVDIAKIVEAGKEHIHFAWAGGLERGQGHYYRIQGPTFLIEYDNTQHDANHIHCVYRDFKDDFGEDLLKAHYEQSHRVGANSE